MRKPDRFWVFFWDSVRMRMRLGTADKATHFKGKLLETNSQARKRLITGTGLGNYGKLGGRTVSLPGSYLEAIGISGFKGTS